MSCYNCGQANISDGGIGCICRSCPKCCGGYGELCFLCRSCDICGISRGMHTDTQAIACRIKRDKLPKTNNIT
jgi:hypothetical protein